MTYQSCVTPIERHRLAFDLLATSEVSEDMPYTVQFRYPAHRPAVAGTPEALGQAQKRVILFDS